MRADDYTSAGEIDLNNGPLVFLTDVSTNEKTAYHRYKLNSISIQASEEISEKITIEIAKARGTEWDSVIFEKTMASNQSIEIQMDRRLEDGDEIRITSTKASIGSSEITLKCAVIFGVGK
jgi:hypothetical protein